MLPLVFFTKQSIGSTAGRIAVLTVGEKKNRDQSKQVGT